MRKTEKVSLETEFNTLNSCYHKSVPKIWLKARDLKGADNDTHLEK